MGQPESLRDFSEDMKYEVIDIPHTENSVFLSETKFVESDWIVCIDGVNKIATELLEWMFLLGFFSKLVDGPT